MIFRKRAQVTLKGGTCKVSANNLLEVTKMMVACMIVLEEEGVDMSAIKEVLKTMDIPIENCD